MGNAHHIGLMRQAQLPCHEVTAAELDTVAHERTLQGLLQQLHALAIAAFAWGNSTTGLADAAQTHTGYASVWQGCCQLLQHHTWPGEQSLRAAAACAAVLACSYFC